ncbi:hypothetical protein DUT90_09080 [Polaribacter sp. WD7]|uniref:hypothetical protein n=1 Tax=Polaribacter sp. WD7 TaxID=2269061 RepID=UPI000DF2A6C2|nr:hypothetical protein [Polaribacter sp. WD7]RCS27242.1 hypothetical protein DUT90_09080 [Polaribacter sp. WD7]
MKIFKLTALALLITSTTAFAQTGDEDISSTVITTDVKKMETPEDSDIEEIIQLETKKEYTPVMLDPKDKYKLNQDIIFMPTQVKTTLMIDNDDDIFYDRKVEFAYEKPKSGDLDFTMSKTGIIINTDVNDLYVSKIWRKSDKMMFSNSKNNRIKENGVYMIALSNGEEVEITISNYSTVK